MVKRINKNSVLLKLVYFCNKKKEVYFKRSEVTEFMVESPHFEIPNKQGFDGNLSYFGYDIQKDIDNSRILLLRSNKLNEKCLQGALNFAFNINSVELSTSSDEDAVYDEFEKLSANKTKEASVFRIVKSINDRLNLQESQFRIFGNKRIFTKNGKYFVYPRVLFDPMNNLVYYEVVNTSRLANYNPEMVFPLFDLNLNHIGEKIQSYEFFVSKDSLGEKSNDYCYFIVANNELKKIDIQDSTNQEIIRLITSFEYDFDGKNTTTRVLANVRVNTGILRKLALHRDNHRCLLCDIDESSLLICSHIKPWSTGESRLDLNNVITLCEFHDALFDKGFISIGDAGEILFSDDPVLSSLAVKSFIEASQDRLRTPFNYRMGEYFKYHRNYIFKG